MGARYGQESSPSLCEGGRLDGHPRSQLTLKLPDKSHTWANFHRRVSAQ